MKVVFAFFVRLFMALLAAKLLLGALGAESTGSLAALTLLLVAVTYLFDFMEYRHQGAWRRSLDPQETGWLVRKAKACWERCRAGLLTRKKPAGPSDAPPEDKPAL